jgi:hypothetical protein
VLVVWVWVVVLGGDTGGATVVVLGAELVVTGGAEFVVTGGGVVSVWVVVVDAFWAGALW